MFLSRIHLNQRCKEARRDLSDPYQLHSTLCRAFAKPESPCPEGEFMWRLEPETDVTGQARVLVQSKTVPDWAGIGVEGWLAGYDRPIDLAARLGLKSVRAGQRFRFRLRGNPCVTHDGKRLGLLRVEDQEAWIARKGEQHGFVLPCSASFDLSDTSPERVDVRIWQQQMLKSNRHSGGMIKIFSVLFDGVLSVAEPNRFRNALETGIGHGKVMSLGLLSVVPIT